MVRPAGRTLLIDLTAKSDLYRWAFVTDSSDIRALPGPLSQFRSENV